jgi:hypothetical protein
MERLEAERLVADAILLERAASVLDRTPRYSSYSAVHWLDVRESLRELAQGMRTEAESYAG